MLLGVGLDQWLPWAVLAIALAALGGLIARFAVLYRDLRREKRERLAASSKLDAEAVSDGEYLVLAAFSPYQVGKQFDAGEYLLKTGDGGISLQINGVVADYSDGETIVLQTGDVLRCERELRIKPSDMGE